MSLADGNSSHKMLNVSSSIKVETDRFDDGISLYSNSPPFAHGKEPFAYYRDRVYVNTCFASRAVLELCLDTVTVMLKGCHD